MGDILLRPLRIESFIDRRLIRLVACVSVFLILIANVITDYSASIQVTQFSFFFFFEIHIERVLFVSVM